ncbi:uncharacterized protein LOC116188451 isoform X1 [Punica granatum]|nr:uncharacterized protein LOC116188451 isoform X1 [Punica granatum]
MVRESEVSSCSSTIKFLCSYGGTIAPRRPDGKLRYLGGFTRILSVDRSVSYAELMVKLVEFCGFSVTLRCQLPNGDLETLISVKSDEDLANIIEEYDRSSPNQKIRAVLSPPESLKQVSPSHSTVDLSSYKSPISNYRPTRYFPGELYGRRSRSPPRRFPVRFTGGEANPRCINPRHYACGGPRVFCSAPCCCNYGTRLPHKEVQRN